MERVSDYRLNFLTKTKDATAESTQDILDMAADLLEARRELREAREEIERLRERQGPLVAALKEILRIHERHVPEATGRKIADFKEAMLVAREALASLENSDE